MTPAEFKAARTALGFSVNGMARVLGISPTHVRRMENDATLSSHRPVTETVQRLIHAYLDGYRPPDWGYDLSDVARARRNWNRKLRVTPRSPKTEETFPCPSIKASK